jgi:hypothetical protein
MLSKEDFQKIFLKKLLRYGKSSKHDEIEYKLSLHGLRQIRIGALNSSRIEEDAKKGWGG